MTYWSHRLATLLRCQLQLSAAVHRLQSFMDNAVRCVGGDKVAHSCQLVKNTIGRMTGILQTLRVDYMELVKPRMAPNSTQHVLESELDEHVRLYETLFSTLSGTLIKIRSSTPSVVTEGNLFLSVVKLR